MPEQHLNTIANSLKVREIMVPRATLVTAKDEEQARQRSAKHPEFNIIPIEDTDKRITHFLARDTGNVSPIDLHKHIVSDSLSILDSVDILSEREFAFVVTDSQIGGYIHYSDLSNRTSELAFYITIQAAEHHLIERIRSFVNPQSIMHTLGTKKGKIVLGNVEKLKFQQAELDYIQPLSFKDILKFAECYCNLALSDAEIQDIYDVRNSVAHAALPFIQKHEDVARLARAKQNCLKIMEMP